MCSTPKNTGFTCKARRFVDDGKDYAAYSKMLWRASNRLDQQDARRKRQAEAEKNSGPVEEAVEPPRSGKSTQIVRQQPCRGSILSWLVNYLFRNGENSIDQKSSPFHIRTTQVVNRR